VITTQQIKSPSARKRTMGGIVSALESQHKLESPSTQPQSKQIVDIITFCEDPNLLDLPGNNLILFPSQKIVLKCLYMGSRGNENLFLDAEEMQWLRDKNQHNVIKMIERKTRGEKFRISELVMVLGRRSSKTVIASIISAYELYKLLMVGDGDPYKFYDIPYDQEIAVINVATSKDAAGRLWSNIRARIRNSPFFANRIQKPVKADRMRIYTDVDLRKMQDPTLNVPVDGSLLCMCGHTNYDALRGFQTICLLFDELAFYDECDKVSGSEFYNALAPSVGGFKGRDGVEDGVKVELSTPGPKSGIFYKLWESSLKIDSMLSFQIPTWEFNPRRPYDDPELVSARMKDMASFEIEYGAKWPEGGLSGIYFPEGLIQKATNLSLVEERDPDPGCEYYFHVDPALNNNRYVLVCVKRTLYRDQITGNLMPKVTLAFTRMWTAKEGVGLEYADIDREILQLCMTWHPVVVSYDQWQSVHSIQMLRQNGFNVVQTAFNRGYKQRIYQNLRNLMQRDPCALEFYDHSLLIQELLHLRYRPTARGVSIGADTKGDCPTDDFADCLAGSAFMASGNYHARLPQMLLVRTGTL